MFSLLALITRLRGTRARGKKRGRGKTEKWDSPLDFFIDGLGMGSDWALQNMVLLKISMKHEFMLYLKILVTAGRFSGIWHYPWLSLSWLLPQSQLKRSSPIEWYLHSHASLWVRAAWICIYCESRFLFQIEITILQRFCKITYNHLILLKMFT